MKKAVLLGVALLLVIGLALIVVAEVPARPGLPAGAQTILNSYLADAATRAEVRVLRTARATWPWELKKSGDAVFGYSAFYQTDTGPGGTPGSGSRPLPYPPQELWCLLLHRKERSTGQVGQPVILIGLHTDIHNGEWLVHEVPDDLPISALVNRLSQIGCDLDLLENAPDDGQARRPLEYAPPREAVNMFVAHTKGENVSATQPSPAPTNRWSAPSPEGGEQVPSPVGERVRVRGHFRESCGT